MYQNSIKVYYIQFISFSVENLCNKKDERDFMSLTIYVALVQLIINVNWTSIGSEDDDTLF